MDARAPTSSSEATSRPKASVPSQCEPVGACILLAMSIAYGDHGVQTKDTSAAMSSSAASTPPMTKLRCFTARCQKPGSLSAAALGAGAVMAFICRWP